MLHSSQAVHRMTNLGLGDAVHRSRLLSRSGILERLFTLVFSGLVYPQIWEDPVVDMEALNINHGDRMITIASGGCNTLSYLVADPAQIIAVDLNGAHVALTRLKLVAAQTLPDYDAFSRFFVDASDTSNILAYDNILKAKLDSSTRQFWDTRGLHGRRRIEMFGRGFYRCGLLGRFIGLGHMVCRLYGADPSVMLEANTLQEQRDLFERHLSPLFDKRLVQWFLRHPASLYGLGIPPAQFHALAGDHEQGMAFVLRSRLETLCCNFAIHSNYFARQAFGRSYGAADDSSMPPYLERDNFKLIRERAGRVKVVQGSMTAVLREIPAATLDAFVLLDAQDWMDDATLTALWSEITRTARRGARVIFRTAADQRLLPGRVPTRLLDAWRYDENRSRELGKHDRSSIYGGFHLYTLKALQ
jgi:S-adenosylmethionine-diacylglycerol 3-amino-3-carboxypropyl transferase